MRGRLGGTPDLDSPGASRHRFDPPGAEVGRFGRGPSAGYAACDPTDASQRFVATTDLMRNKRPRLPQPQATAPRCVAWWLPITRGEAIVTFVRTESSLATPRYERGP
jgi:hypothetical protein